MTRFTTRTVNWCRNTFLGGTRSVSLEKTSGEALLEARLRRIHPDLTLRLVQVELAPVVPDGDLPAGSSAVGVVEAYAPAAWSRLQLDGWQREHISAELLLGTIRHRAEISMRAAATRRVAVQEVS